MDMKAEISPAGKYYKRDFLANKDFPLSILHMDRTIEYPLHSHEFLELVLIYAGKGLHIFEGDSLGIGPGDMLFIPAGREHAYREVNNLSYVNIVFDKSLTDGGLIDPETFLHLHLTEYDMAAMLDSVKRIDKENYRKESGFAQYARALFTTLLIDIKRIKEKYGRFADLSVEARVREVIETSSRNLTDSHTLSELADMARISSRHFSRIIKKLYGVTAFQYINQFRIKESCALLADTDMTVTQIAFLSGFDDSSYYSVMFRKIMNMSPSAFRNGSRNRPTAGTGKKSSYTL